MVRLHKRDLDQPVAQKLPPEILKVRTYGSFWVVVLLGVLLLLTVGFVATHTRPNPATPPFVLVSLASLLAFVWSLASLTRQSKDTATVTATALRHFGKTSKTLNPIEQEYCRTVATLAESSSVGDAAAQSLLEDLNQLLSAHRAFMAQELPGKTRQARQIEVQKVLQRLRASLKRAAKLVTEPPRLPAAVAEEAVEETISRVRMQARSLEQATDEVQALRVS